jgi:hypothetical protein
MSKTRIYKSLVSSGSRRDVASRFSSLESGSLASGKEPVLHRDGRPSTSRGAAISTGYRGAR